MTPSSFQPIPLRLCSSHAGNHSAVTSTFHEALTLEGAFCSLHVSLDLIIIFPVSYQHHPKKTSAVPGLRQPICFFYLVIFYSGESGMQDMNANIVARNSSLSLLLESSNKSREKFQSQKSNPFLLASNAPFECHKFFPWCLSFMAF